MSTISVPLTPKLEVMLNNLIEGGVGETKAQVMRKALARLAEEEIVREILQAEKELEAGLILRGDLRKLAKKIR